MRVLITGGAGNLARYCLAELRQHGHRVTLFDRLRPEEAPSPWQPDVPCVVGDLTAADDCQRAVATARAEAIIHLGGIAYASDAAADVASARLAGQPAAPADATFRVNVLGAYCLLEAARQAGVRVVAFASTLSVLMSAPQLRERIQTLPIDETHPIWPTGSYGLSKALNEEMLRSYSQAGRLRTVALRMAWVAMPHYPADWAWNPPLGQPATDPGDRFTDWGYLDARDAAAAYRLSIEADALGPAEVFYLATDRTVIEEPRALAARYYPELAASAAGLGPDDLLISIGRARARLGYQPRHSWRGPAVNDRVG